MKIEIDTIDGFEDDILYKSIGNELSITKLIIIKIKKYFISTLKYIIHNIYL